MQSVILVDISEKVDDIWDNFYEEYYEEDVLRNEPIEVMYDKQERERSCVGLAQRSTQ
jgi:hypothetical protein